MSNDHVVLRNPIALMVLRVWMERGSALPLRAYIRQTTNSANGFQPPTMQTDVESAVSAVRTWLESLLAAEVAAEAAFEAADAATASSDFPAESPTDGVDTGGPHPTNGADPATGDNA